MNQNTLAVTPENEELNRQLAQLAVEFLDLFTRHKGMVEDEYVILTSLYLEKLGCFQLELLQKKTEAARLKMKMKLIQAAINRDERPDLQAIEYAIQKKFQEYYAEIEAQAAALDQAKDVLSHLVSEEDTLKLKELFRVLCKRLHPDLNPDQTEDEKELFIKVKSAYDLQKIAELQHILLYLNESKREKIVSISGDEKRERIEHLESNVKSLKGKIDQLYKTFPFNVKELIVDEKYIVQKQGELKSDSEKFEQERVRYATFIDIMIDE